MPDSNGFGDYTESGQVIPVSFRGRTAAIPIACSSTTRGRSPAGASSGAFPRSSRSRPCGLRSTRSSALWITVRCGSRPGRWDTSTAKPTWRKSKLALEAPNFLLKIIPHVDGTPRICELVEYRLEDIVLKGAWTGPAALSLAPHALAPVAELPVLEIVSAIHILADLTLGLGRVVHDYLQQRASRSARASEKALVNAS